MDAELAARHLAPLAEAEGLVVGGEHRLEHLGEVFEVGEVQAVGAEQEEARARERDAQLPGVFGRLGQEARADALEVDQAVDLERALSRGEQGVEDAGRAPGREELVEGSAGLLGQALAELLLGGARRVVAVLRADLLDRGAVAVRQPRGPPAEEVSDPAEEERG